MALFENPYTQGHPIILVPHENDIALHAHSFIYFREGEVASGEVAKEEGTIRLLSSPP